MMTIVVVCRSLPGHRLSGGMEQLAHDLMTAWVDQGDSVIVLTTPGWAEYPHNYTIRTVVGRPGRYSQRWRRALPAAVLALRPDIIFSVSGGAHGPLVRKVTVPVVMQAHGTSIDEIRSKLRTKRIVSWVKALKNVLGLIGDLANYRRYTAAVAVSPSVARSMNKFPTPLRVKHLTIIENGAAYRGRRTERPAPGAVTVTRVGFVGRLNFEKGADLLVEAAQGSDWAVSIVGDGPEMDALRRIAPPNVAFRGKLSHREVLQALEGFDVLVAVSRRIEGLPLVVLESLAAGVPCVVSHSIAASFDGAVPPGVIVVDATSSALAEGVREARGIEAVLPENYTMAESASRYGKLLRDLVENV